ncbi:titin homolog [Malaya genurostris]|uniref:titin homolog n=1 Tax=Malaya genurostris TaxID=325434 RepID=UPI0026F3D508|nr:titin homolog [Malaya genurostris]
MTKLVSQLSSSASDQPLPVSEPSDDREQSPQASSTPAKQTTTTPTGKRPQQLHPTPPPSRRTSTRLTSIRNDSLSSSSSTSSSSSLSSVGDWETTSETKATPTEDVFKVPSITPGVGSVSGEEQAESSGIVCRLPLDRLQAILSALNILKIPSDLEQGTSCSSPSPTYKLLCLYCDRTFASQNLMAKHTDRVHRISKERRSSSRVIPTVSDGAFPNCSYCNKGKVATASDDLSQLFKHLVDQHSDRYFACEPCGVRFPSDEARDAHLETLHPSSDNSDPNRTRPKSKAALKSFNVKKNCEILTTPLTIQVDFDTEAMKNLTIENIDAVDSLSAALGLVSSTSSSTTRLRSSGRTSATRLMTLAGGSKSKLGKKSDKVMMRSSEPMLSRLGIAQHRTSQQGRKTISTKTRRKTVTAENAGCSSSLSSTTTSQPDNHYNKITKLKTIRSTLNNPSGSSESDFVVSRGKNDIVSTFDEDFYEKVNANVRQNLSCHLDGKIEASDPNAPSPISPVASIPTIRSTVVKSPLQTESKIHEATNLPALTVFPTLLTVEQYGTDFLPVSKIKKPITKNSWKWKWDFVKKYKYVSENGKIVKKVKQPTLGLRDLSKLDMWTQLTMRTKHELIRNRRSMYQAGRSITEVGDSLRQEQRKQVDELNHILDTRVLPQITLEQHDQSIIKIEPESLDGAGLMRTQAIDAQHFLNSLDDDFIESLHLLKLPNAGCRQQVILSGEWARPRCYICYCCGDKFSSLKQVEEHKTFRHPYVYSTYYEIVGRELIEKQLFKHFFIPLSALTMHRIHYARLSSYTSNSFDCRTPPTRQPSSESAATITEIKSEDSSSNEATSFSTATSSSSLLSLSGQTATSVVSSCSSRSTLDMLLTAGPDFVTSFTSYPTEPGPVQCSKCQKECLNTLVLYAHILNCTNDYIWLQAKKRMKYRRANRRRKGCNKAALAARKAAQSSAVHAAVEKSETASNHSGVDADSSSTSGSESKKKPKSPPRPREKDSDIVKRLTANLPAKRISRQIFQMTKQIRKRPQMSIVKGKKQVVSTLAPSKAGVPRGANAAMVSKLRSGKIAVIPTVIKKATTKSSTTTKPSTSKPSKQSEESPKTVKAQDETIKQNDREDTKEQKVEENKEDKTDASPASSKRKLVSRGRNIPVRTKHFVTRRNVQWKGNKTLQFRKNAPANKRILRSGVKVLSTGTNKKTKKVLAVKKEVEKGLVDIEVNVSVQNNGSKQKESESLVDVHDKSEEVSSTLVVENLQVAEVKTQITAEEKSSETEKPINEEINVNPIIEPCVDEVPKEIALCPNSKQNEILPAQENVKNSTIETPVKEIEKLKESATMELKAVPEETPNQPITQEKDKPLTPVKSPSQASAPPSVSTTPSSSNTQHTSKRKPKKLNDCIAMLTGKLSEKLGVDFFNQMTAKTPGPKKSPPAVETRSSKQTLFSTPNPVPPPAALAVLPLQIPPPQLAPLPLVMNTRHSPALPKPAMLSPVASIITPMEDISDEPLNLSKNSPIGRSIPSRTRDIYNHQKAVQHLSPPPRSPTTPLSSTHHLHPPSSHLKSPQAQQQQHHLQPPPQTYHQQQLHQSPQRSPTPTRNLPSIKLPPGLIIERVEYKSRPVISKEAPSVTIVARRQPPPSMENRSVPTSPAESPTLLSPVRKQQQHYGDPRKSTPPVQQLPSPKQPQTPQQLPYQQPSIASTLRQERPLENRISVTITEAKSTESRHQSQIVKQPPVTLNIPERPPIIDRTPSVVNPTTLIIPTVSAPAIPPVQSHGSGGSSKRNRRKSMYVVPSSISETSTPAPVSSIAPPAPFLPGLSPLSFLPHSLLAGPPLGLDLQRLAAVGLSPHLKPPVIPPLTIPTPSTPSTAAAAALLEKILLPNRDMIVQQIENAAAQSRTVRLSPERKKTPEEVVPAAEMQTVSKPEEASQPPPPPPPVQEKKTRSRAKTSRTKLPDVVSPVEKMDVPVFDCKKVINEEPKIKLDEVPKNVDLQTENPTEKLEQDKTDSSAKQIDPNLTEHAVENVDSKVTESDQLEPPKSSETPTESHSTSAKTVRKRRKNELAAILSDQLLESFKEVDQSALQDLKMMHDMSCEKPDIKFSLEQIPQLAKRKINPRNPELLARNSPTVISGKKTPAKKTGAKDAPRESATDEVKDKDRTEIQVVEANIEPCEMKTECAKTDIEVVVDVTNSNDNIALIQESAKDKIDHITGSSVAAPEEVTTKTNTKKSEVLSDLEEKRTESSEKINTQTPAKLPPKRRTRKLSIDIDRMAGLERKGRQKQQYLKQMTNLDLLSSLTSSKKTKPTKRQDSQKPNKKISAEHNKSKETPKADETATKKEPSFEDTKSKKIPTEMSRSKTPFPFPKQKKTEKSDLDRLKDSLNIETPTKKIDSKKKAPKKSVENPEATLPVGTAEKLASSTQSPRKKVGSPVDPSKKPDENISLKASSAEKTHTKRKSSKPNETDESVSNDHPPPNKKSKDNKTQQIKQTLKSNSPKQLKSPAQIESKPRSPSPAVSLMPKNPTPPKRIMARRSSVFVDKNLAQYMEEKDAEQELLANSTFKDDLILTSRRGTRSQGGVDFNLVASFAETAMKPRDPRRKSAAAVAAAAAAARRAEEDRRAAEEERKRREEMERCQQEEVTKKTESANNLTITTPPLRRISARRASVFVTQPPEKEIAKAPEENLAEIGKATKRQYRRRGSVYQSISFLDEEEQQQKEKEISENARSKTPGPSDQWEQDLKSNSRRRNQNSVFNGTPEPMIESLLEPLSTPTTGTKRRTKNSQLAENLSKLYNIEEEIQLIDRSRRKPRKSNTPVIFEASVTCSTPVQESPVNQKTAETTKIDELVKVVENEVAKASIAPKPRDSLSFSNDDEDESPKLNKLVQDIINKSESESDSEDDNMSLACFVRRDESFLKPTGQQLTIPESLEQTGEDESNSAIDDDISVTTEITSFGGSIKKRKRRKSICVTKLRRQKNSVDDSKPVVMFNCDLCRKVFKKQDAYNKHRMTLSHIAKLSEQEYLEAQQKKQNAAAAVKQPSPITTSEISTLATSPPNTMKNLSQEEKLFYECCSMLKESNADNENLNLTVSLKSDEMTNLGITGDQNQPPEVSVTYPNPFAPLPPQNKTADSSCFNMGDSFPSFPDVSESETYIQTINQRSLDDPFAKLTVAGTGQQSGSSENEGNLSPQNSTKSTSSQASVFSQKTFKTKGALKGYDNFKVSIPMSGIQIAKESKLDTLADVALCGDIPKVFELKDSEEEKETTPRIETPKADDSPKNGLQTGERRALTKKESSANKLGFRAKKNASSTASTPSKTTPKRSLQKKSSTLANTPPSKKSDLDDIYAFQDSPPEEMVLPPSYTSNKKLATGSSLTGNKTPCIADQSATTDQGEESQLSSLSFSDRDDFVYGTNTLSEEDEDDKSSSYSSLQTTPKKPVKADVQKKSLIMGRIFKKSKDKPKDEQSSKTAAPAEADNLAKPVAKDFDKLFDKLKKLEVENKTEPDSNAPTGIELSTDSPSSKMPEKYADEKDNRNLRRRSTQKKLTETPDSDEYEDFNLDDIAGLIDKKDKQKVEEARLTFLESEKESVEKEEKLEGAPLKISSNQPAKDQTAVKSKSAPEKNPIVTDETIRQVMESVIMEVSMSKNHRTRDNKRRVKSKSIIKGSAEGNEPEQAVSNDSSSEAVNALEEHILESSVVISSKTITTKFKQKLNSAQTGKQKFQQSKQKPVKAATVEEPKKKIAESTVNNNNTNSQKSKVTTKTKDQRKESMESTTKNVATATNSSAKLKQRKGPQKKMKNIAYDPDSDFEDNIKCKKVKKKLLESDIEANLKIEQLNAALSDSILMPAPRRKRNAAETLYFWSSSSEDDDLEADYVEMVARGKKQKKKATAKSKQAAGTQQPKSKQKQTQPHQEQTTQQQQQQQSHQQKQSIGTTVEVGTGDDTSSSSEHMQQHGWIVGDSHKKLVTLLAHAKGKQDNRTVKAAGNRRKL